MFYDVYKKLCDDKGISPSKVALDLGISKTSVTRWKNGVTPNSNILSDIANYFNVTVDYLINNEKEKPSPDMGRLNDEDKEFLMLYRQASPELREAIRRILKPQ